jgi:hypothetical protein
MRRYRARLKLNPKSASAGHPSARPAPPPVYSPHAILDARSLAMHVRIVAKITRDRSLLAVARQNIERWVDASGADAAPVHTEWRAILAWDWPRIAGLLLEQTERGVRLRQSTPFTGILSPKERWAIHEMFKT